MAWRFSNMLDILNFSGFPEPATAQDDAKTSTARNLSATYSPVKRGGGNKRKAKVE
jgi:hypothetical protein